MFSALKKFGNNVKKASKNMEEKLEKAGTAMKDAANGSPKKHGAKDDKKSEATKSHKEDVKSAKSKKSKKSRDEDEDVSVRSNTHTNAASVHAADDAHSDDVSVAASTTRRAASVSSRASKAKSHTSEAETKPPKAEPPAKPPRATTPLPARPSSPSPSDITFQIDDVSPGRSLERVVSASGSRHSSIQMQEEAPTPEKARPASNTTAANDAAPSPATAPAAPTKKSTSGADTPKATASVPQVNFHEESPTESVASAGSIDFHGDMDEGGDEDAPSELQATERGASPTPPSTKASTRGKKSDATTSVASKKRSAPQPRENQSSRLKKRTVTVGDGSGRGASADQLTDATFARTAKAVPGPTSRDAGAAHLEARRTSGARYRSASAKTRSQKGENAPTPERPQAPPADVVADIPDNSSTFVSPTRQRREPRTRARTSKHANARDGEEEARGERPRHRRRHHSRTRRDTESDSVDSLPLRDHATNSGASYRDAVVFDEPEPLRRSSQLRSDWRDHSSKAAAPVARQERSRPQSRRPRASPVRHRDSIQERPRYHDDPLDYREMMAQCRREARALSRRRARRASYGSESENDSENAYYSDSEVDAGAYMSDEEEEEQDELYGAGRSRGRRHPGFRSRNGRGREASAYESEKDRNDDYDDDDEGEDRYHRYYSDEQREHYRGRRRFPESYGQSPHRSSPLRSAALLPDPMKSDRANIGRFYPSLIHEGPPSVSSDPVERVYGREYRVPSRHPSRQAYGSRTTSPLAARGAGARTQSGSARRPQRSPPRPHSRRYGSSLPGSRDATPDRKPTRSAYGTPQDAPQPLVPLRRSTERSPVRTAGTPTRRRSATALTPKRAQTEEELLEEVEFKMAILAEHITFEEETREQDMRSSPFERLYHMNNRRDRDERRNRLAQYHKLESIREKLLSGAFEKEMAEKEAKRAADEARVEDPSGVFQRLYNTPRRRGGAHVDRGSSLNTSRRATPLRGGDGESGLVSSLGGAHHSRTSSAAGSVAPRPTTPKLSSEAVNALCTRLYGSARASTRHREEEREESEKARQYKEMEDFLIGRLVLEMERRLNGRVLTAEELQARAREELQKRMQANPTETQQELLHGSRLKPTEMTAQASRLARQGYVSKEALAAKKETIELTGCTFEPAINEYYFYSTAADQEASRTARTPNQSRDLESSQLSRTGASRGPKRPPRTEMLYQRAEKEKAAAEQRRQDYDREMRVKILRSRMESDHHFRRRVELDPGLAERFMRSVVI